MSYTPRTDANQWTVGFAGDDRCVVWAEFARQLERELNAATAELAAIKRGHGELGRYEALRLKYAESQRLLNEERARSDALRDSGVEALMIATAWAYVWSDKLSPESMSDFKKHEAAFLSAANKENK